jgi:hypothetical protein
VADKIPIVDHLERGPDLLRPVVGALRVARARRPRERAASDSSFWEPKRDPGLSGQVHDAALTSTAATRGFWRRSLSLAEDVVAIALGALMFFVPGSPPSFWRGLLILSWRSIDEQVFEALGVLFFRLKHPRRLIRGFIAGHQESKE